MGVDPIDGTKAFISNCFIFGTLISLVRDGRPILGAIASPLTGHVLVGLGVEQTLLGERPVQVRSCSRIEDATVLAMKPWDILALVPVIEGAGGRVTSLDGGDPLQASDLLASDGGIHDEVRAAGTAMSERPRGSSDCRALALTPWPGAA